jgi:PAS domain S-box-containing protein
MTSRNQKPFICPFQKTEYKLLSQVTMTSPDTRKKTTSRTPGKKGAKKTKAPARPEIFKAGRAETQSDFTVVFDPDFRILYANPAMGNALGCAAQEMAGTSLLSYVAEEFRETMALNMEALRETGEPPFHETVLLSADGTRRPVIVKGHPVRYNDQTAGLFFLIDITERKALEDLLRKRAEELLEYSVALQLANKKLTLLSSITRHDINNQLTGLKIYLTLLEEEQADPALAVYCEKAAAAADQIGAIVRFAREYENIGISAPVWHDCRRIVDEAAEQDIPGRIAVHNDLPAGMEIFADPLVGRVFFNLIDNAVRYGNTITAIQFYAREEDDGTAVIVCEDNGDGVPEADKERIFEMGYGRHTGMGLALSREILAITGITIRETGTPGRGACFELTVPPENCRFAE